MQFIRFLSIWFYVVVLSIISWLINGKSLIGIDDANIYMVYMRNFANGHGFVYNIGGEKVEGFTSLLWTLLGSTFFYISNYPEKLLLIFNVTVISYTLYIVSNYLDRNAENRFRLFSKESLFFLAVVGVTPGYIDWTVMSLMDTGLWCFLLTLISLKTIQYKLSDDKFKHYSTINLIYVLLVYCRPESMLLVPFYILLNAIKEYVQSKSIKTVITGALVSSIFFITSLFVLVYWRLDYFGYPFPNTYYAKVSSSITDNIASGKTYIYILFYQKPFVLVLLSFSALMLFKAIINKTIVSRLTLILLLSILGISLVIPLYSGGDHFKLHRFIMPFIPVIVLLGVVILKEVNYIRDNAKLILLFLIVFFSNDYNFKYLYFSRDFPIRGGWNLTTFGRDRSEKLNDFFKDNKKLPSQGVVLAGSSAYLYNGETIDLLGLNNTKMAHADKIKDKYLTKNHASFNSDVFFELSPDLFWYYGCGFVDSDKIVLKELKVNPNEFIPLVFKNIHRDSRFIERYGYYRIDQLYNQKITLEIFANKKFVSSLDTTAYKITTIRYE